MSLEKLKQMKAALENEARKKANVEGQLESAMARLKELGYETIAKAEEAVAEMDVKLDELETEINTTVAELEEKYAELLS